MEHLILLVQLIILLIMQLNDVEIDFPNQVSTRVQK